MLGDRSFERTYEFGEIVGVNDNGTIDVLVPGREFPYTELPSLIDPRIHKTGMSVLVGKAYGNPYMPFVLGDMRSHKKTRPDNFIPAAERARSRGFWVQSEAESGISFIPNSFTRGAFKAFAPENINIPKTPYKVYVNVEDEERQTAALGIIIVDGNGLNNNDPDNSYNLVIAAHCSLKNIHSESETDPKGEIYIYALNPVTANLLYFGSADSGSQGLWWETKLTRKFNIKRDTSLGTMPYAFLHYDPTYGSVVLIGPPQHPYDSHYRHPSIYPFTGSQVPYISVPGSNIVTVLDPGNGNLVRESLLGYPLHHATVSNDFIFKTWTSQSQIATFNILDQSYTYQDGGYFNSTLSGYHFYDHSNGEWAVIAQEPPNLDGGITYYHGTYGPLWDRYMRCYRRTAIGTYNQLWAINPRELLEVSDRAVMADIQSRTNADTAVPRFPYHVETNTLFIFLSSYEPFDPSHNVQDIPLLRTETNTGQFLTRSVKFGTVTKSRSLKAGLFALNATTGAVKAKYIINVAADYTVAREDSKFIAYHTLNWIPPDPAIWDIGSSMTYTENITYGGVPINFGTGFSHWGTQSLVDGSAGGGTRGGPMGCLGAALPDYQYYDGHTIKLLPSDGAIGEPSHNGGITIDTDGTQYFAYYEPIYYIDTPLVYTGYWDLTGGTGAVIEVGSSLGSGSGGGTQLFDTEYFGFPTVRWWQKVHLVCINVLNSVEPIWTKDITVYDPNKAWTLNGPNSPGTLSGNNSNPIGILTNVYQLTAVGIFLVMFYDWGEFPDHPYVVPSVCVMLKETGEVIFNQPLLYSLSQFDADTNIDDTIYLEKSYRCRFQPTWPAKGGVYNSQDEESYSYAWMEVCGLNTYFDMEVSPDMATSFDYAFVKLIMPVDGVTAPFLTWENMAYSDPRIFQYSHQSWSQAYLPDELGVWQDSDGSMKINIEMPKEGP